MRFVVSLRQYHPPGLFVPTVGRIAGMFVKGGATSSLALAADKFLFWWTSSIEELQDGSNSASAVNCQDPGHELA